MFVVSSDRRSRRAQLPAERDEVVALVVDLT
jgi:hypothetical protein